MRGNQSRRADLLACRFGPLSRRLSEPDWKVRRTGRLESPPYNSAAPLDLMLTCVLPGPKFLGACLPTVFLFPGLLFFCSQTVAGMVRPKRILPADRLKGSRSNNWMID